MTPWEVAAATDPRRHLVRRLAHR